MTAHSIYVTNDYKRCVCDHYDSNNPACLEVDDECVNPEDDSNNDEEEEEEEENQDNDDNSEDQDDEQNDDEEEQQDDDQADDQEDESEDNSDDSNQDTCPAADGIWTGVDWTDSANNYKVVNGVVQGTSAEARRRIKSARNLPGDGSNYMSLTNV